MGILFVIFLGTLSYYISKFGKSWQGKNLIFCDCNKHKTRQDSFLKSKALNFEHRSENEIQMYDKF